MKLRLRNRGFSCLLYVSEIDKISSENIRIIIEYIESYPIRVFATNENARLDSSPEMIFITAPWIKAIWIDSQLIRLLWTQKSLIVQFDWKKRSPKANALMMRMLHECCTMLHAHFVSICLHCSHTKASFDMNCVPHIQNKVSQQSVPTINSGNFCYE